MKKIISLSLLLISIYSCKQDDDLDLLIINGDYYTASTNSEKVSAIGVSDGIISYVGDRDNSEKRIG